MIKTQFSKYFENCHLQTRYVVHEWDFSDCILWSPFADTMLICIWAKLIVLTLECCMLSPSMFKLKTIYHSIGIKACTTDGKSAWIRFSQLLCGLQYHTCQVLTIQLCRCKNLCKILNPYSLRLHNCHQSWMQCNESWVWIQCNA